MGLIGAIIAGILAMLSIPVAGAAVGISATGPVAGGCYAWLMSTGTVIPAVQSFFMTIGPAIIAKFGLAGAAAGAVLI